MLSRIAISRKVCFLPAAVVLSAMLAPALVQTPAPNPLVVIGRDQRETAQVVGKNYLLRFWLSNVGGAGVQQIRSARLSADGNVQLPGIAPIATQPIPAATQSANTRPTTAPAK